MIEPTEGISQSELTIIKKIFEIMKSDTRPSDEDMNYLINHVASMVNIIKKSILSRFVSLGVDASEGSALLELLVQMANIAGGINFFDFAVTERMSESMNE